MTETFQILILLLAVISVVGLVAKRLQIPPAILLVITGVVLALIPGLPSLQLAPDLVLLLVLPPVIYSAAVEMSWQEFRFNLRPISLLAIGCVVFTTIAVAAATHWLLGFPWAVGFVLGAIVSPPDAVAPLAIAQRMQLPRRLVVVLEGEGLANDATALVLYRFAVMAVSAGRFRSSRPAARSVAIVAGEVVWGIGVGWLILRLRRWVRDPGIEIMMSILTPFLAYWPPEQLGGSGVLATLATGLYVSWNGLRFIPAATRLPGAVFWDFLTYLIEGMVFLITGLQARTLLPSIRHYTIPEIALAAVVVCVVVIVGALHLDVSGDLRAALALPRAPPPRSLSAVAAPDASRLHRHPRHRLARRGACDPVHRRRREPISRPRSHPDPDLLRDLRHAGRRRPYAAIVVRKLGLANAGHLERRAEREEEFKVRRRAIEAAIERLETIVESHKLPEPVVGPIRAHQRNRLTDVEYRKDGNDHRRKLAELSDDVELALIEAERELVNTLYRAGELKDEGRRRIERELDLRDTLLANLRASE